jgi:glycosyltransferase involved in cell wall biosynthesis
LYLSHDAYISASLGEGLGLPVAEAIMIKTPVLANYWGGHKSLLESGQFWEIDHEVSDQLFCSDPSWYAKGQKCAYSSPKEIKKAILQFCESNEAERQFRAEAVRSSFIQKYGLKTAGPILKDKIKC